MLDEDESPVECTTECIQRTCLQTSVLTETRIVPANEESILV